ncbi:DNA-binding response regulator [Geomicrobium sp. JCM 19055]|nr:DNA-binding response regulator [Geomicrobium sp. JCM 19055]
MSENRLILVVDDEKQLIELIKPVLEAARYDVVSASNGIEALEILRIQKVQLVLLDVMMPGMDGFQLCHEIRQQTDIPIIMLTARGEEEERVHGLRLGADDYIVKPFGLEELLARMQAVLRRFGHSNHKNVLSFENLTIDVGSRNVTVDDERLSLSKKEFDLLLFLCEHPSHVFSREHLHEILWDKNGSQSTLRTVDTHVKTLRVKLKSAKHMISTVWGVGYKFQS